MVRTCTAHTLCHNSTLEQDEMNVLVVFDGGRFAIWIRRYVHAQLIHCVTTTLEHDGISVLVVPAGERCAIGAVCTYMHRSCTV